MPWDSPSKIKKSGGGGWGDGPSRLSDDEVRARLSPPKAEASPQEAPKKSFFQRLKEFSKNVVNKNMQYKEDEAKGIVQAPQITAGKYALKQGKFAVQHPVTATKNVAKAISEDAAKSALSLYEIPSVVRSGGKPTNRDYNVPIVGRTTSHTTDFARDVDAVIEGKRPMIQLAAAPTRAALGVGDIAGAGKLVSAGARSLVKGSSDDIAKRMVPKSDIGFSSKQIEPKAVTGGNGFSVSDDAEVFTKQRKGAKGVYQSIGKADAMGGNKENAGLRILEDQADTTIGRKAAQDEIAEQISKKKIKPNKDGTITVYRGGEAYDGNKLVSVSTNKEAAAEFGDVVEIKVRPDDIAVAKGLDPDELLVRREALSSPGDDLLKELNQPRAKVTKESFESKAGAEVYEEMATAEKGQRYVNDALEGMGNASETIAKKSSFPDWVPSKLRSRKLFDAVQEHLINGTTPTDINEKKLYKIVKEQIDTRSGVPKLSTIDNLENPVGTGEMKTTKLAKGIEEKAIEKKLVKNLGDLPEYQSVNMKEQARFANELIQIDEDSAIRIALGKEQPPAHLLPESVLTAVEEKALREGNSELIRQLGTQSSRNVEASVMGQRIRALGERNADSPVAKIKEVFDSRMKAAGKNVDEKVKVGVEEIKATVKPIADDKVIAFINEVRCR